MFRSRYMLMVGVMLVAGCAYEPKRTVPPTAKLREEGDRLLIYTAPTNGIAYIYDATDDKLIYSGDLQRGQQLKLDASKDQVDLDDQVVWEETLQPGNMYRIYFDNQPTNL